MGDKIDELPHSVIKAMKELDDLAAVTGHNDYELGYSLGLRVRILSDLVIEALKQYAPDVLKLLPAFI